MFTGKDSHTEEYKILSRQDKNVKEKNSSVMDKI